VAYVHHVQRELWEQANVTTPWIEVDPDTGRREVRWAGEYVMTDPAWWRRQVVHGWEMSVVVLPDGRLQLDTAGELVFEPTQRVCTHPGKTIYRRAS